jgi:hypothetical protein
LMDRFANFFNLAGGCTGSISDASCSQVISAQGYLDAKTQEFFLNQWYDLPGNANDAAQGEMRYNRLINDGYDYAFGNYWGTGTLTVNGITVQTIKNPTLDQMAGLNNRAETYNAMIDAASNAAAWAGAGLAGGGGNGGSIQTAYGADSGSSDIGTHNLSSAYHVNISGGAEYFVQGATEQPLNSDQANTVWNALELARKAIESRPLCSKYLGEGAYQGMRTLWDKRLYTYFHGVDGGNGPAFAETISGLLSTRTVLYFNFFNPNYHVKNGADFLGATAIEFQATILMHEVRHYLCPDCKYAEPHDANTWNQDIFKYCFK